MDDIKAIFGERLKEARTKKKKTQQDIAGCCQTQQSAVSAFEKGTTAPNLEVAAEIANYLGVTIDWLCGFDDKNRDISPYQWIKYMDKLISKAPEIHGKSIISLALDSRKPDDISLVFSGNDMQKFFSAYYGIQQLKEVDNDLYEAALEKLCEKYKHLFTPGIKVYERGEDVPHPPIWR